MKVNNQLVSFCEDQDLADAASLHAIFKSLAPVRKSHKGFAGRAARESIQKIWQEARMPHPRHTHNKPMEYPWSEHARELFFSGKSSNNLILEHVKPASHLSDSLFDAMKDPAFSDQQFLEMLVNDHKTFCFAVISRQDNSLLDKAGLRSALSGADGEWARYEHVGMLESTFMALTDDPRFTPDMIKTPRRKRAKVG